MKKTERTLVIYDGTSAYILPESDFNDKEGLKIEGSFYDIDSAQNMADGINVEAYINEGTAKKVFSSCSF